MATQQFIDYCKEHAISVGNSRIINQVLVFCVSKSESFGHIHNKPVKYPYDVLVELFEQAEEVEKYGKEDDLEAFVLFLENTYEEREGSFSNMLVRWRSGHSVAKKLKKLLGQEHFEELSALRQ